MLQDRIIEYFERDPQLRRLFIFDELGLERGEYESMNWPDGYHFELIEDENPLWFNLKYKLTHEWKDDRVIIYCWKRALPISEEARLSFPLLGEMVTGKVFQKEGYDAYMQQHHISSSLSPFVSKHIGDLQTSKVEKMLQPVFDDGTFNPDVAIRAFITSYMGSSVLKDWNSILMSFITLDGAYDDEKIARVMPRIHKDQDIFSTFDDKLYSYTGQRMDKNRRPYFKNAVLSLKYNLIVRNIDVMPTDPYKVLRVNDKATIERMERFMEFVRSDPKNSEEFFESFERLGEDVKETRIIDCYGANAGYWYLPKDMCYRIIDDNVRDALRTDPNSVIVRMDRIRVSNPDNEELGYLASFVTSAAQYYALVDKLQRQIVLNKPEDYIRTYTETGYRIDFYYRKALEFFANVWVDGCSEVIESAKLQLDKDYAAFTNNLNLQWIMCLDTSGKTLRSLETFRHQEDFYNDFVKPSTSKQAVIICDALRYEVAQELADEIFKTQHQPELDFAIAMLPTETVYCKPSLLPHNSLTLSGSRMLVDGVPAVDKESREAQLKRYKDKSKCIKFEDVEKGSMAKNRDLFKNELVYIFHNDIDDAGHDDDIRHAVSACQTSVQSIAKLVYRMLSSYNVTDVLITADHGFLLNDIEFQDRDKQQMLEEGFDKKSRYYLTESATPVDYFSKYQLRDVSGIDSDAYVSIPSGTNRVSAPNSTYKFAHGGASLQEIIVPIIRIRQRRVDVKDIDKVGAKIIECSGKIESSVLFFSLLQTVPVSNDFKKLDAHCAIFDGNKMVSREEIVSLNSTDTNPENRKTPVRLTLTGHTNSSILQLRVWDKDHALNPLDTKTVTNSTLIERDEF